MLIKNLSTEAIERIIAFNEGQITEHAELYSKNWVAGKRRYIKRFKDELNKRSL